MTLLHHAASRDDPRDILLSIHKVLNLAQIRCLIKIKDDGDDTFLHTLAQCHVKIVEILDGLYRQGLSLHEICSIKNKKGQTILHCVAEEGSACVFLLLLEKNGVVDLTVAQDIVAQDANGNTPLHAILKKCVSGNKFWDVILGKLVSASEFCAVNLLPKLEKIVLDFPDILEAKDGEGTTIESLIEQAGLPLDGFQIVPPNGFLR